MLLSLIYPKQLITSEHEKGKARKFRNELCPVQSFCALKNVQKRFACAESHVYKRISKTGRLSHRDNSITVWKSNKSHFVRISIKRRWYRIGETYGFVNPSQRGRQTSRRDSFVFLSRTMCDVGEVVVSFKHPRSLYYTEH